MVGSRISSVGRKLFAAYVVALVLDILVLAFAARVNIFQEFFFVADLFPLGLSVATLILFSIIFLLDVLAKNSPTARPLFTIGFLYGLSIFWLAFNTFSTSRWRNIPLACSSIPDAYSEDRTWCKDMQVLKALVWIVFLALFITATFILRYTIIQHRRGMTRIWQAPLSRFDPRSAHLLGPQMRGGRETVTDYFNGGDSFMRFERMTD